VLAGRLVASFFLVASFDHVFLIPDLNGVLFPDSICFGHSTHRVGQIQLAVVQFVMEVIVMPTRRRRTAGEYLEPAHREALLVVSAKARSTVAERPSRRGRFVAVQ